MSKFIKTMNDRQITAEKNDFYATDPIAIDKLFEVENFSYFIWECACGQGHLSERMKYHSKTVYSTDLIDRGYGHERIDFLKADLPFNGDIITNPPYKYAVEFVEKALELTNNKVAMFLKLTFLESTGRVEFFKKYPPKKIYVFSKRVICAKNGDFENTQGSAVAYAWFVWEKGYQGLPTIDWI